MEIESKQQILERRKELEQELTDMLKETKSDFTLDHVRDAIFHEEDNDDMMKVVAMFDRGGDASELSNVLELVTDAWNYFPHKALGGISPAEKMMGGFSNTSVDWNEVVEHTAREEQEGKELWNKLQAKEVACENLNDGQYGVLGEYFMGTMAGDSHTAMNAMMIQAHGEDGEEQIHIVMGKRLSGCDISASFPAISGGWMPMMNMMWGGWSASPD